jgi:AbrB family looped-hinge helix DNA binding protein
MVEIKTKIGAKGQVVIPKVFRDEYSLKPGMSICFNEEEGKLVISRPGTNVVEMLRNLPKKNIEHDSDVEYENQIKERLAKSGLKS